jgi:iron complex outermembrane receptor protein
MGDTSALQVAGIVRKRNGYDINTVNRADVNDQDVTGGRAAIRLSPTTRFSAVLSADFIRERSTPGFAQAFVMQPPFLSTAFPFPQVANGTAGFGVGRTDFNQQLDGDRNIHTLQSDLLDPINDNDLSGGQASLSFAVNDRTTLRSITSYRKMTHMIYTDADGRTGNFLGSTAPTFHLLQDQDQSNWSQEFQVTGSTSGALRYVAGVYLFGEKNEQLTENMVFAPRGRNNHWIVEGETTSYAGYASFSYQPTDKTTITAGGRYTNDEKDFSTRVFLPTGSPVTRANPSTNPLLACARATVSNTTDVIAGACTATAPAGFSTRPVARTLNATFSAFTPRFAVDYAANPTTTMYASYSRGFKSGAFDGRSNTGFAVLSLLPIKPEKINSYEVGVKTDFARGKARMNVAAFLNDFQDLQGTGTDPNGNFFRTTLGDVETRGAELEARVVPATGLEIYGQLSLLRTEYKKVTFDQVRLCGNLNTGGRKLELKMSPPQSYQVGATYTTPPSSYGRLTFGGTVSGKGRFWHTSCNGDTGSENGFTLFDAQVAWESRDNRFRIAALGENLADEKYLIGSFAVGGLRMSSGYFNPPRRYSVILRYAFN